MDTPTRRFSQKKAINMNKIPEGIKPLGNDQKPRALILASVASMIDQFNMQNIQLLLDSGYQVDVACNCKEGNTISDERVRSLVKQLAEKNVSIVHVPIPRKITNAKSIIKSISQVKRMCNEKHYALLHCHSPIGSVVARVAAKDERRHGTKVIYTAHGFHFYKGAPKLNWLLFYPIEKICSKWTDVLITINTEDYAFAKKRMDAGQVEYMPGVGVEIRKFHLETFDKDRKRNELGIEKDDFLIMSVGELNQNKNHEVIVKAIANLDNPKIHYFIAGKGNKADYLQKLARHLHVNLHLLGYRTDIVELLNIADVYAFPSYREGLSVALMEAMSAGLPCIVSKIRGNVDLIDDCKGGYWVRPDDIFDFSRRIEEMMNNKILMKNFSEYNLQKMKGFDISVVREKIKEIYGIK